MGIEGKYGLSIDIDPILTVSIEKIFGNGHLTLKVDVSGSKTMSFWTKFTNNYDWQIVSYFSDGGNNDYFVIDMVDQKLSHPKSQTLSFHDLSLRLGGLA